jgi:hypothetical protein
MPRENITLINLTSQQRVSGINNSPGRSPQDQIRAFCEIRPDGTLQWSSAESALLSGASARVPHVSFLRCPPATNSSLAGPRHSSKLSSSSSRQTSIAEPSFHHPPLSRLPSPLIFRAGLLPPSPSRPENRSWSGCRNGPKRTTAPGGDGRCARPRHDGADSPSETRKARGTALIDIHAQARGHRVRLLYTCPLRLGHPRQG